KHLGHPHQAVPADADARGGAQVARGDYRTDVERPGIPELAVAAGHGVIKTEFPKAAGKPNLLGPIRLAVADDVGGLGRHRSRGRADERERVGHRLAAFTEHVVAVVDKDLAASLLEWVTVEDDE